MKATENITAWRLELAELMHESDHLLVSMQRVRERIDIILGRLREEPTEPQSPTGS